MTEKKFHIPSIIIASVAVLLGIFAFIAESIITAIVAIIICIKKKDTHRTKIGIVLSAAAIILSLIGLGLFMEMFARLGTENIDTGYWLLDLIF